MIQWAPAGDLAPEACPVCATAGPHPMVLRLPHGGRLHEVARCGACASAFYRDRTMAEYRASGPISEVARQSYIELGAGIASMATLLFAVEDDGIDSLLDVGCGFGFPVDLARSVLGWRTVGMDPAPDAIAGRAILGADIRNAYLDATTDLGAPFRLAIASEVIEHVPDPLAFLALIRARMAPAGVFALTTPNAGALGPATAAGTLMPLLSPGLHLVVFSAAGLEQTLRRAGFGHVVVQEDGGTLIAYAADRPFALRSPADLAARRAEACRAYYGLLMQRHPAGAPLWNGAALRLLDEAVSHQSVELAFALYESIAAALQARFGIDLRHPSTIAVHPAGDLRVLALRQPLCVPLLVWHRARLEARIPGRNPIGQALLMSSALALCVELLATQRAAGIDDLGVQSAIWSARIGLAELQREIAPAAAPDAFAALAVPSPPGLATLLDPPRAELVARGADWFIALVHAGRYWEAARLVPVFEDLALTSAILAGTPSRHLHLLYCCAVLGFHTRAGADWQHAVRRHLVAEATRTTAVADTSALGTQFLELAARLEADSGIPSG